MIVARATAKIKENVDSHAAPGSPSYRPGADEDAVTCRGRSSHATPRAQRPMHPAAERPARTLRAPLVPGHRVDVRRGPPLRLDCGVELGPFTIAYQTYGTLNAGALERDPDLPCADRRPVRRRAPSDHRQARLVGADGRARPAARHRPLFPDLRQRARRLHGHDRAPRHQPARPGGPTASAFPVITIADMVRAQKLLIDHLGIEKLFCVIGGSMGGMQVLQWAASYPERVFAAVPIAGAARHSAQNIAFHEVGRQAIMADPDWCGGDYLRRGASPRRGLAVARMAAHITYLSETALHRKFGRNLQDRTQRHLRLRRRFPGRELSAPPGIELRRPLRRQLLSLHHPRHGLFRPGGRAWRRAGQRLPRHAGALLRHLLHQRLAVPDLARAAPSCTRSTRSPPM